MNVAVEATSLSALTRLASQPPLDPNQSHPSLPRPLVLYIARVPGSKDVFLTPMKPRDKVVTAEDIESSLYFLHIHGPEDERILRDSPPQESADRPPSPQSHRIPPLSTQNRVPQSINHPNTRHYPLPHVPLENISPSTRPPFQLPGLTQGQQGQQTSGLAIRRKPIGGAVPLLNARPNVQNQHNIQAGLYASGHQQPAASVEPPYPQHEVFPDVNNWIPKRRKSKSPLRDEVSSDSLLSKPAASTSRGLSPNAQKEIRLTLIRRDPATSEQWNVASICSHPNTKCHDASGTSSEKLHPRVELVLESPGYSKFSKDSSLIASKTDQSSPGDPNGFKKFSRELRIEDSKFQDNRPGHYKALSENSVELSQQDISSSMFRRGSEDLAGSKLSLVSSASSQPKRIPRKGLRKTGYTFLSPWNGRCEFSTTIGNSSLKCNHSIGPTMLSSEASAPVQVSELRFNLPRSTQAPPSLESSQNPPRRSKFLSRARQSSEHFEPSPVYLRRGSEPSLSASILDLSLGQEKAGGGFAGKQAKLGKLIIENEGLKMLDLLVAANMSLWWKAYEKG